MPIYEYQCPDCGHRFEKLQKVSEGPVTLCPSCGEEHVKKLVSATSFILKGSGWYKDHYGLKSSADGGGSRGGTKAADGKPAASSESKGGEGKGSEGKGSEGKSGEGKGSDAGAARGGDSKPAAAASAPAAAPSSSSFKTGV